MTAPQPPSAVPEQIQQHEAAAIALEAAAVAATAAGMVEAFKTAVAWMQVEWSRLFGTASVIGEGAQFHALTEELASRIQHIQPPAASAVLEHAQKARDLGVKQGLQEANAYTRAVADDLDAPVSRETRNVVDQAVKDAAGKVESSRKLLAVMDKGTLRDVETAVAPAQQAGNDVTRTVVTVVHAELNVGITAAANHLGLPRIWIAERTACLHCLALSGRVVAVGHEFPASASFGAKPLDWTPIGAGGLTGPPRHPHCRCRCSPYKGSAAEGTDFSQALKREAERSVLNGYALPSESVTERAKAADRLLQMIGDAKNSRSPSGWKVPQSVKDRARRALRKGTFTTKPVPRGQGK